MRRNIFLWGDFTMSDFLNAIVEGIKEGLSEGVVTIVTRLWVLGHIVGGILLVKWIWPEGPGYGLGITALTAVLLAVGEIELVSHQLGRGPVYVDLKERAT